MKAVILAGGYGKRLRPLTDSMPKSMVQIAGRPIVEWQLLWLIKHGIDEFILCVGYLKDKIINYIGSGQRYNVKVGYVVEDEPLGTAGALRNAAHVLARGENFFVINGDIITDLSPVSMLGKIGDAIGSIAIVPLPSPYGIIRFDSDMRVKEFAEKPTLHDYWINAGVYLFKPEVIDYLPEKGDLERETLPVLARQERLIASPYREVMWKSLDSHKDLEEAESILLKAR
ncbi:MAG: nucleotidyltransferase family protein [Aigarchaeota archaeon]|nr:nucleotidyltransferase family protein [Aigarchaeota archaeon]MDW8092319.1 nucleotidyltransferase family protein [Nitrososphaerota archaeon]